MKRTFQGGISDPPLLTGDRRYTQTQSAVMDLVGRTGLLPAPQNLQQYSEERLTTMTAPASTLFGAGNERVEVMNQVIETKMIFTAQNEYAIVLGANGIAPLVRTDRSAFEVSRLTLESSLPDRRPVRGRVTIGKLSRDARSGTLQSYGKGIEMPLRFYLDPLGPLYFRLMVEQMNIGVRDLLIMIVYNMIEHAFDWGQKVWADSMARRAAVQAPMMRQWLEREMRLFGLVQREERPMEV